MSTESTFPLGATGLNTRVSRSILRLGYEEVEVSHLGEGHVKLTGTVPTVNDRSIVIAAVRSVAGVTTVSSELE